MNTKNAPKNTEERRPWVKYQLDLLGLSLSDIARDLKITRGAVYHVFREPRPRIELAIAKKLRIKPEDIWPERYEPKVKQSRKRSRHKTIKARRGTQ